MQVGCVLSSFCVFEFSQVWVFRFGDAICRFGFSGLGTQEVWPRVGEFRRTSIIPPSAAYRPSPPSSDLSLSHLNTVDLFGRPDLVRHGPLLPLLPFLAAAAAAAFARNAADLGRAHAERVFRGRRPEVNLRVCPVLKSTTVEFTLTHYLDVESILAHPRITPVPPRSGTYRAHKFPEQNLM